MQVWRAVGEPLCTITAVDSFSAVPRNKPRQHPITTHHNNANVQKGQTSPKARSQEDSRLMKKVKDTPHDFAAKLVRALMRFRHYRSSFTFWSRFSPTYVNPAKVSSFSFAAPSTTESTGRSDVNSRSKYPAFSASVFAGTKVGRIFF